MSEKQKLRQIFTSIYDKVRKLQNNNYFDKAVKREASKTYVGMSDDFFFRQMVDLIFQSGLRGQVWQKYESEIRKEFGDYKVELVAKYTQKDVERMLNNPKMLKRLYYWFNYLVTVIQLLVARHLTCTEEAKK